MLKKIAPILITLCILEFTSLFYLYNFDLNGNFSLNNRELLLLKRYISGSSNKKEPRFLRANNLNYMHNPKYKLCGKEQHNKLGFRNNPILDKTTNEIRIICIGGSTTYGFGVCDLDSTYPSLLSFALNTRKKDSYIKFNVINAGLEGSTSFDELQLYLYKVRYLKPDVVVLHSGGNDAIYMSQQEENYSPDFSCVNNYDFTIKPAEGWGRYLYRSNIISLIHIMSFYRNWQYFNELDIARGRKSCPSIWFDKSIADVIADSSFANYHFYHNYKTLVRALKDDGVQVISIPFLINEKFDIGNYAHYNEVNNQIIKKISLQEQTIYVNLSKADIPDSYYIDDCHLNGNGNKLKANVIADKILSDIQ